MRLTIHTSALVSVATAFVLAVPMQTSMADPVGGDYLDAYTAVVSPAQLRDLVRSGHDVGNQRPEGENVEVSLVLSPTDVRRLGSQGIHPTLTRVKGGKTVREFAAAQAAGRLHRVAVLRRARRHPRPDVCAAAANPQVAKLVKLGHHRPGPRDPGGQAHPGRAAASPTGAVRRCSTAPPSTPASGSRPRSTGG